MYRAFSILLLAVCSAFGQSRAVSADYALILTDSPLAQRGFAREALSGAQARSELRTIQAAQDSVIRELARRNVAVLGSSQILLNAVFVAADRDTAAALRSIPGVARVAHMPRLKPDMSTAAGLVYASAAWTALGGVANAGLGVKIGIIDSGIDQNHAAFQDPSLTAPSGFPKGNTNYTNNKVIVARSYVALAPYTDPDSRNNVPDDITPADHVGHGTAIAMIAAGVQNAGPLGVIQGIAPKAFLGSYKIQGSPGVNTYARSVAVISALSQALSDGMDIVTVAYSEGDMPDVGPLDYDVAACGGTCDPIAQAVQNAVAAGMVVVASGGNDGDLGPRLPTLNSIHTPGTAPSAITVGATTNAHLLYQAVKATAPNPPAAIQAMMALEGDGPQLQTSLSGLIKDVTQVGNDGLACSALTAGSLNRVIALIQRGTCSYTAKINNAQDAGAVGVIIYQSAGNQTPYGSWGASDTGIPAMMIGYNDGLALKAWVAANLIAAVTLDPAFSLTSTGANAVAAFSSRGPAIGTFGIKPEIMAPGVGIYTATQKLDPNSPIYHPSGYTGVSGTSMSVGLAAGAAALVKQRVSSLGLSTAPYSLTAAQIAAVVKSGVVNSAAPVAGARVTDAGAGLLNAGAAVGSPVAFDPATVSFGKVGTSSLPMQLTLAVTNLTGSSQTVAFTVSGDSDSRATLAVTPANLTLSSGQRTSVTVGLTGLQPLAGSYQGYIQAAVNNGANTYRIPYIYFVSDGVFDSAILVANGNFIGSTGDTGWWLELKALDRFGIPVIGTPVTWLPGSGGGAVGLHDSQTYANGISAAIVNLGTQPGDNLFTATIGGQVLTFDGYARGLQTPTSIVDAAAYQSLAQPKGYAPGSYITVFGTSLAPATQAFSTVSLPFGLSDTNAAFYASGVRSPAPVSYVSPSQVNLQVPWELAGLSAATLAMRIGDNPGNGYVLPIATYSPGIFQYYDSTQSHSYADVWDATQAYWVSPSTPAKRGDKIQIYCNGLGPVANPPATGAPAGSSSTTIGSPFVTVNGISAQSVSSGLVPGTIGVYEVDVIITQNTPVSTSPAPLILTIGGVASQPAYMPIQ